MIIKLFIFGSKKGIFSAHIPFLNRICTIEICICSKYMRTTNLQIQLGVRIYKF
jgi:hypothetical protein